MKNELNLGHPNSYLVGPLPSRQDDDVRVNQTDLLQKVRLVVLHLSYCRATVIGRTAPHDITVQHTRGDIVMENKKRNDGTQPVSTSTQ